MSLFRSKQDYFIYNLARQAELNVIGLEGLVAYMQSPCTEHEEKVNIAEKDADEVRRMLVDELNRTFVTPFDREDIYELSRAVDDVLDYAHSTVHEMNMLAVKPNEHMCKMAQHLLDASREMLLAFQRLEKHPSVANDHAREAKRIENDMEKTYREAIAELFAGPAEAENIVNMMKTREIYRHLSNAADRADEAANVISNIVVKMT
ncbi:MAG: DUF47 family protein [Deltaproteobacteria bacterium]|nr:DUF47 family protein [Deltaproteobacteria bacterium]